MYDPSKPYKKQVLHLIKQTWQTPFIVVQEGTYPIFTKRIRGHEIDHTDGIGTKGYYHWQRRKFKNAVLDALAMNLNDLALMRATPFKLQNHIVLPKDDHKAVIAIVENLARECRRRNIAMTGGETSIQNTCNGMDVSLTVSGFVQRIKQNKCRTRDVVIGLPSNGIHANGYTVVRQLFGDDSRSEFTRPTRIYWDKIMALDQRIAIHGMMHITGGAFTKLKDLLNGTDIVIHADHALEPHSIFKEIYERGVSDAQMYQTFNCGIGFILSVDPRDADRAIQATGGATIGEVVKGSGRIRIASKFSDAIIRY